MLLNFIEVINKSLGYTFHNRHISNGRLRLAFAQAFRLRDEVVLVAAAAAIDEVNAVLECSVVVVPRIGATANTNCHWLVAHII